MPLSMTFLASVTTIPVTLETGSAGDTAALLGGLATGFLVLLLVIRELLGAYANELPAGRRRAALQGAARGLGVGVLPLLAVFGLIVLLRVLSSVH